MDAANGHMHTGISDLPLAVQYDVSDHSKGNWIMEVDSDFDHITVYNRFLFMCTDFQTLNKSDCFLCFFMVI